MAKNINRSTWTMIKQIPESYMVFYEFAQAPMTKSTQSEWLKNRILVICSSEHCDPRSLDSSRAFKSATPWFVDDCLP